MDPRRIPSTDGVEVALHDLGGAGPSLLISHATGFHAHCYEPLARELDHRLHSFGLDYRGHGATAAPDHWEVDWEGYGDDALAAARAVGGPLLGFGHSMGGACLLMAAHREPELFSQLVVFEPIVFPPPDPTTPPAEPPLVAGARRRRADFASFDEAMANYASKPPLNGLRADALRAYVEHGFEPTPTGVTLRCRPEHEAQTFATGASHRTWEVLGEIRTPVLVVAGRIDPMSPAAIARPIAEQLPMAEYLELPHLDHFGPMTHPDEVAALVVRYASG